MSISNRADEALARAHGSSLTMVVLLTHNRSCNWLEAKRSTSHLIHLKFIELSKYRRWF